VCGGRPPGLLLLVLFFAPLGYLASRIVVAVAQSGVWVASEAVFIRGPGTAARVPLADAERFVAEVRGNQPTVSLERRDSGSIGIWALNRNGFMWEYKRLTHKLEPVAAELNEALEHAKRASAETVAPADGTGFPVTHAAA
jgi:hypothetical protein